jgi:hypothetical protein
VALELVHACTVWDGPRIDPLWCTHSRYCGSICGFVYVFAMPMLVDREVLRHKGDIARNAVPRFSLARSPFIYFSFPLAVDVMLLRRKWLTFALAALGRICRGVYLVRRFQGLEPDSIRHCKCRGAVSACVAIPCSSAFLRHIYIIIQRCLYLAIHCLLLAYETGRG